MPRADFEAHEVIQPGTVTLDDNPNAGIQANVTYVAQANGVIALGRGGETGGVIKYPPDHTQRLIRDTDDESVRLYGIDKRDTVVNEGLEMDVNDPSIGQNVVDRHMATRAVAAYQMDSMIGLNALSEEKFGVDTQERMFGMSVMADGAGIQSEFRVGGPGTDKKVCFLDAGFETAAVQRGLSDLEVSDYLSGQIDRHAGNIFVSQNGKVTGIDNDLAFPSASREHIQQRETDRLGGTNNKSVVGMPRQIHAETAQKILAISPDDMRRMLADITPPNSTDELPGRLTEAEINGACQRLSDLQNELRHPNGAIQVVTEFNMQTYEAALEAQKQAFNAVFDQERAGTHRATFDTCNIGGDMDACPKTSYLGAMLLKQEMIAIGLRQDEQANQLRLASNLPPLPSSAAIRDLNSAPAAPRNEQYAEFAKQAEIAKQTLKANPSLIENADDRRQVMDLKQQMAEVKEKIAHYDKETAKLQEGKLGAKLRSLASGGTEGRKEFYADKKMAAQQQLSSLERQLDAVAANAVPVALKEDLMNDAQAVVAARQPVVAQNNALQPPVAVQPNPALAGMVPNHPAPPPPGQFNHPPPSDMAPAVPNQDNLAQGNDQPKAAKTKIAAKNKEGDLTVKAAEDELEVSDPDDLDADVEVEVEAKKEGLAKAPSVAEMLKRTNSAPQLGGHKAAQEIGGEEPKPASNSLRASGSWQAAKPSGPKPGGNSLTSSHL